MLICLHRKIPPSSDSTHLWVSGYPTSRLLINALLARNCLHEIQMDYGHSTYSISRFHRGTTCSILYRGQVSCLWLTWFRICVTHNCTDSLGLGRKTPRSIDRVYNGVGCIICPNLWFLQNIIMLLQIRLQSSIPIVQTAPMQLLRKAWPGALCEKFSTAMSKCSSSSSLNSLMTSRSNGTLGWSSGNDSISLSWLMMIYAWAMK